MFIRAIFVVTMLGAIYFHQIQAVMAQYNGELELSNFALLNGGSLISAMGETGLWSYFAHFAESVSHDTHLHLP